MSNFFIFIIALFILAAVLRVDFFFTVAYFFAAIYLVSRVWSKRMIAQLTVRRNLVNRAFLGDDIDVTLRLENLGWLPIPWLMIHDVYPIELAVMPQFKEVISLKGHATHIAHYQLRARRRGYYEIGPLRLNAGDLLGLHHWQHEPVAAEPVIVYPKICTITQRHLHTQSPQPVLPTSVPIFEDPSRITGVRGYTWGDNPRHIHWTATASTGQMMVKQFQPAIARETAIFLNMAPTDGSRSEQRLGTELAITTAASLAHHIVTVEKLPVGLHTLAVDPLTEAVQRFSLPTRKGREQLRHMLDILARIQAVEEEEVPFSEWLQREMIHLSWGTTLVVITHTTSASLLGVLHGARQSGFTPVLVFIRSHQWHQEVASFAGPVVDIWEEKDIERWARTR